MSVLRRMALRLRLRLELLKGRPGPWVAGLALALAASMALSASVGAVAMGPAELLGAASDPAHPLRAVLVDVRLPRLLGAMAVGAALAASGALLQTVVRNPLADPGILGVTAGAGLAAVITLVLFPAHAVWVPVFAFAGGLATVAALLGLAWSSARPTGPLRIVLSGVALQAVLLAGLALLTFAFADRAPAFAAFVVGSLNGLGWRELGLVVAPTLLGVGGALAATRTLDVLLLDDGTAGGLGVGVRRARFAASSLAALLAAGAVSVAGLVGFVGLVVPNALRLVLGPTHRRLLPAAIPAGALLVLLADTVSRTALAPLELPVGALLAMLGGPTFLLILWRRLA